MFMQLSKEEVYDYMFATYEKSSTIGINYGYQRFEKLLAPFGLSRRVSEVVKRILMN